MALINLSNYTPARMTVDGRLADVLVPRARWYDALLAGEGDEPIHRWTIKVRQDLDSPSIASDCWQWAAATDAHGYGRFSLGGEAVRAHAILWAVEFGCPPSFVHGQQGWETVDLGHLCHDRDASCAGGPSCPHRRCVNVEHLALMSHSANVRAGRAGEHLRRRTECPSGHDYETSGYPYTDPSGVTRRYCRSCQSGGRAPEFVGLRKTMAVSA